MLSHVPWPLLLGSPDQVEPVDATVVVCFEWLLFALCGPERGSGTSRALSLPSTSSVLWPLLEERPLALSALLRGRTREEPSPFRRGRLGYR